MTPRVVVLDDEANMGKVLAKLLRLEEYEVSAFERPADAIADIEHHGADVLLTDLRMPGMTGEEVLEKTRDIHPGCEVIVMTAYGTVESAMRCVRNGAYDYVTKPFDTKTLLSTVRSAARKGRRAAAAAPAAETGHEILGESAQIEAVRELIRKIAPSDSAVLVYGESGTGKELAARAIHRLSPRANQRFMAVNCASIPESLIESELFGHEKGAFTGAHEMKIGLIEAAHEGTLFLDEIGELPLSLQAKLLRTLQEREITRIGSTADISVDIRVIAATNLRLEQAVQAGQFRQDLYYRLNVLKVKMPPLRERVDDIRFLTGHFLKLFRKRAGRADLEFDDDLIERLMEMTWPGNVRELRNIVERIVVLSDENPVTVAIFQELGIFDSQTRNHAVDPAAQAAVEADGKVRDYREARDAFELNYLRSVLKACDGNVSEAAKKAGISRRSFYEKIEKLGIDQGDFKS